MTAIRKAALVAGLLYYSTHVTSVAALAAYGRTFDGGWVLSSGSDGPALVGVALETLLALGVLGTGIALLPVIGLRSRTGALAFSALRTLEAAVIAAGTLPVLALVWLRPMWASTPPADAVPLGQLLTQLHTASFLVGQGLIISVTSIVLATVLLRTRIVPAWIGWLGLVGGALVLVSNTGQLFGGIERSGSVAGLLAMPVFAFELSFATYLVVRGAREAKPAVAAGRPQRP